MLDNTKKVDSKGLLTLFYWNVSKFIDKEGICRAQIFNSMCIIYLQEKCIFEAKENNDEFCNEIRYKTVFFWLASSFSGNVGNLSFSLLLLKRSRDSANLPDKIPPLSIVEGA